MAFTIANSGVTASANIEASGAILYFRPTGDTAFIDMGWISVPSPTVNTTTNTLSRNRNGVAETVKSVTASVEKIIAFNTASVQDADVVRLYTGGEAKVGAGSFSDLVAFKETLKPTEGDAIIVRKPTESTAKTKITYYPKASLRPGTEGEDSGFSTLDFELTVLSDPTYVPPSSLVDFSSETTETGVVYLASAADVTAVLNALADS